MLLQTIPPPSSPGVVFFLIRHHLYKWTSHNRFDGKFMGDRFFPNSWRRGRRCFSKCPGSSISCSNGVGKDLYLPSNEKITNARVLYAAAPAMGHDQESHPESHFRVPAIVNALEKMELTPKFRGSEIIELHNFKPASVDDIASVHAKAYISGLEKAMDQASQQGIIFIDGSGPTYATATMQYISVFDRSHASPVSCTLRKRYDGHVLDPLASLQFSTGTYYMLASSIKQLAKDLCAGRCVFFLEGGYNLKSLSYSVADSFRAFLGEPSLASEFDNPAMLYDEPSTKIKQAIERV